MNAFSNKKIQIDVFLLIQGVSEKKMSECQTKAGNQECPAKLAKLTLSISHSLTLDMLNNFWVFYVYAQKSVFIGQNVNGFFDSINP